MDVRFIAAMNVNPEKAVEDGVLRQDLFYRLDVIDIRVPPLRERTEDILPIINHYVDYYNKRLHKNIIGLTELAKNTLISNDWPGNVRELRNCIEYAVNMASGEYITLQELPARVVSGKNEAPGSELSIPIPEFNSSETTLQQHMNNHEKSIISNTLQNSTSITSAAKKLGLTRQALQYKMQKHGIGFRNL